MFAELCPYTDRRIRGTAARWPLSPQLVFHHLGAGPAPGRVSRALYVVPTVQRLQ